MRACHAGKKQNTLGKEYDQDVPLSLSTTVKKVVEKQMREKFAHETRAYMAARFLPVLLPTRVGSVEHSDGRAPRAECSQRTGTKPPRPRRARGCAPRHEAHKPPRRRLRCDAKHAQGIDEQYAVLRLSAMPREPLLHDRQPSQGSLGRAKRVEDGLHPGRQGGHVRMSPRYGSHESHHLDLVERIDARKRWGRCGTL